MLNSYDRCKGAIITECVVGTAIDMTAAAFNVKSVKSVDKAAKYQNYVQQGRASGRSLVAAIGPRQAATKIAVRNLVKSSFVAGGQYAVHLGGGRYIY